MSDDAPPNDWRRTPTRALRKAATCALCSAFLAGCSGFIVPPPQPVEPTTVIVLDHGRHSSIVLPFGEAGAVRYSYGDWNYYARGHTGFASGMRALALPTKAALGRQTLAGPVEPGIVASQLRVAVVAALEIAVETSAMRELRDKLETMHASARDSLFHDKLLGVDFVHHPDTYSLRHNSNRMVGHWLEQLGCEIGGTQVLSNWILRSANPSPESHAERREPQAVR